MPDGCKYFFSEWSDRGGSVHYSTEGFCGARVRNLCVHIEEGPLWVELGTVCMVL